MDRSSQNSRILKWLESGHSISPLEAFRQLNCLRLSGRIKELRDAGYKIQTTMITTKSKKRVASYSLEK